MNEPADGAGQEHAPEDLTGLFTEHVLAYGGLVTALFRSWQKSLQRKLLGAVLAVAGVAIATLLLTAGIVAAAWSTPYRWAVLLAVAGFYLLVGATGIWLLLRRPAVPAPANLLGGELRKDAQLLSEALRKPPQ